MEKKQWTVINPHDPITFIATDHEAALIADRLLAGLYFVENEPEISGDQLRAWYDQIWFSKEAIVSLADAYDSFLVGSRGEFEARVEAAGEENREAVHREWHIQNCTSTVDLCAKFWEAGEKIRATEPDDPNAIPLAAG